MNLRLNNFILMRMNEMNDSDTHSNSAEDKERHESFEIEVSDLLPETQSHHLLLKLAAWKTRMTAIVVTKTLFRGSVHHMSRQHISWVLISFAALLALLAGDIPLLSNESSGGLSRPSTPSTTFSQIQIIALSGTPNREPPTLGPIPTTCRQTRLAPLIPSPSSSREVEGVGKGSIWITGFTSPQATLTDLQPMSSPQTGWIANVTLFVQKDFAGTLTLEGGPPLVLSSPASPTFHSSLTIDLSHLDNPASEYFNINGEWKVMPVFLLLPLAGCYTLQEHNSTTSGWIIYFATGSIQGVR